MQNFLESILNQCLDILESNSGSILLLDKNNRDIVVRVARGEKSASILGERVKLGQGISGMVAQNKQAMLVEDVRTNTVVKELCRTKNYRTHSFLSVPLMYDGCLLGVLNVTEKASGQPFSLKELSYVSAIACCAAGTIDRIVFSEHLEKQLDCFKNSTAVTNFASAVSHELNNPLDGAIRYNKLALMHSQDNEIIHEYLMETRSGLKRMESIIRSLMQLSFAGNRNKNTINRVQVDVNQVIIQALDFYKHELAYRQIEINTDFAQELPKIKDCGLQQIFLNCIKNSIDSLKRKGQITIKSDYSNNLIKIDFIDNGKGIPENIKQRLFEPFFSTKTKGQGLGLAIIKEIVDCYKGKVEVENMAQGGVKFSFSIPIGDIS
ncbi:MAG: GAF domain-containing sensor histidine kinase [Candidatus Omnitrophica bacterium]|nr:GAF domain-containing sensor histidine kinase [Candidatus Omnitrophota bacterium]